VFPSPTENTSIPITFIITRGDAIYEEVRTLIVKQETVDITQTVQYKNALSDVSAMNSREKSALISFMNSADSQR